MLERPHLDPPIVEFFRGFSDQPLPVPASDTVKGFLPGRAKSHCPPVTHASGYGWWLFPPCSFAINWDGQKSLYAEIDDQGKRLFDWVDLSGGIDIATTGHQEMFDRIVELHGQDVADALYPDGVTFLNADPRQPNLMEVSTGLYARTSPGWSLLIRSVPNWPSPRGVQNVEGMLETDWYRGGIPTMLRIVEPGVHNIYQHIPIACAQPVHQAAYAHSVHTSGIIHQSPDELLDGPVFEEHYSTRRGRGAPEPGQGDRSGNYRTLQRAAHAGECPYTAHLSDMVPSTS